MISGRRQKPPPRNHAGPCAPGSRSPRRVPGLRQGKRNTFPFSMIDGRGFGPWVLSILPFPHESARLFSESILSDTALDAARMLDTLPESVQSFAFAFIKKPVLAWDPDFPKATPGEARLIAQAEQSGFVDEDEIDWDDLSKAI